MGRRFYSSVAAYMTLTAPMDATQTTCTVTTPSGLPSTPFTAIIDRLTTSEEVVTVTAVAGSTLTLIRGVDGSSAKTHTFGGAVEHGVSARDYDEPNAHIQATSGVHGVSGTFVDTTTVQTLSSKTLTTPTIADFTNASHSHTSASAGGLLPFSGAWNTYSPGFGAGSNPTLTTNSGRYVQIGKTVIGRIYILVGGSASAGPWFTQLPVNGVDVTKNYVVGTFGYYVAATTSWYTGVLLFDESSGVIVRGMRDASGNGYHSVTPAVGDALFCSFSYETS